MTTETQATVQHHDPTTRTGSVMFDDGSTVAYDRAAFDASRLRVLRIGQRVRVEQDPTGAVTAVYLISL